MASLNVNGSRFTFNGPGGETLLLNCEDLLVNKSRVSMHRLPGQNHPIIPEILLGLIKREQENGSDLALPFGLIDTLLTAYLIRSAKPVKVLEYGSGEGKLSVHLAELLGEFHEESTLVCAYDTIEPEWMERISCVERLPKLRFLAGDFGELDLRSHDFDIVVINGSTNFLKPDKVISDAVGLAKENGTLVCWSNETPFLESCFKFYFEKRTEYEIMPSNKILLAKAEDCSWRERETSEFQTLVKADIRKAKNIISSRKAQKHQVLETIKLLQKDISVAVKQGETGWKIELLAQKEKLIDLSLGLKKGAGG